MAQGEGFKFITVTAPEEDDVVIVAGAVGEHGQPETPEPTPAPEPELAPESASEPVLEPAPAPAPAPAPTSKPKSRSKPTRSDDYRETTLEDLEQGPMPLAQRIVIIAAIVCIIGAVIYYFAFMR